uniref:Uncharacterized protein n=1 Tax=Macaca fascicularis TaxID=9541 RepID=A0A2K5V2L1_MACFA
FIVVKQSQMEYQETCYLRRGPGSGQQSFLRCDVVPLASCSENSQQHRSTSRKHRLENSPPWFCLNWLPFCSTHQIQLLESGTRERSAPGTLEKA